MVSFRQQMQELAEKIITSRVERERAVAQFPKMRAQLSHQVAQFLTETRRDLQLDNKSLDRQLKNFNAANKRSVSRLLRDTRAARLSGGRTLRSRLQREVNRNRNEVARALQQNSTDRLRSHRHQMRSNQQAAKSISARVATLRASTRRMTRELAYDRLEARRIWLSLSTPNSTNRVTNRMTDQLGTRLAERTIAPAASTTLAASTAAVTAATAEVRPALAVPSAAGSLSGLTLPPQSAQLT